MSRKEIFQMKQSKIDELNDYAVRSAYPAISYTVKKPPVEITEINNRRKITDFGQNVTTENTNKIHLNDKVKEKEKEKEKEGKIKLTSIIENNNLKNTQNKNGVIILDIASDSDSSVEIIGKEKKIENIEFSDDDFDKSNLSQGTRTKIPRGKVTFPIKKEEEIEEEEGRYGVDRKITNEKEKGKEKGNDNERVKRERERKDCVKEVEKEEEVFSSRIIMMEDPPHLLQRLFNSDEGLGYRGGGDFKNSINYR